MVGRGEGGEGGGRGEVELGVERPEGFERQAKKVGELRYISQETPFWKLQYRKLNVAAAESDSLPFGLKSLSLEGKDWVSYLGFCIAPFCL